MRAAVSRSCKRDRPVRRLRDVIVEAGAEGLERGALVGGLARRQHERDLEIARAHIPRSLHRLYRRVRLGTDVHRRRARLEYWNPSTRPASDTHSSRRLQPPHGRAQLFEVTGIPRHAVQQHLARTVRAAGGSFLSRLPIAIEDAIKKRPAPAPAAAAAPAAPVAPAARTRSRQVLLRCVSGMPVTSNSCARPWGGWSRRSSVCRSLTR